MVQLCTYHLLARANTRKTQSAVKHDKANGPCAPRNLGNEITNVLQLVANTIFLFPLNYKVDLGVIFKGDWYILFSNSTDFTCEFLLFSLLIDERLEENSENRCGDKCAEEVHRLLLRKGIRKDNVVTTRKVDEYVSID
jgi:hypothetical protein